jgi:hypothetical protein
MRIHIIVSHILMHLRFYFKKKNLMLISHIKKILKSFTSDYCRLVSLEKKKLFLFLLKIRE